MRDCQRASNRPRMQRCLPNAHWSNGPPIASEACRRHQPADAGRSPGRIASEPRIDPPGIGNPPGDSQPGTHDPLDISVMLHYVSATLLIRNESMPREPWQITREMFLSEGEVDLLLAHLAAAVRRAPADDVAHRVDELMIHSLLFS